MNVVRILVMYFDYSCRMKCFELTQGSNRDYRFASLWLSMSKKNRDKFNSFSYPKPARHEKFQNIMIFNSCLGLWLLGGSILNLNVAFPVLFFFLLFFRQHLHNTLCIFEWNPIFTFSNIWHLHDSRYLFDCNPSHLHFLLFHGSKINSIERKIHTECTVFIFQLLL